MDLTRRSVLAAPSVLLAQSSSNEFRVAYIGVGNRGSYTMRQLMRVPGVKVVAISDLDPERMKAAIDYVQSQGGEAAGFADYRKMLESRKDIDAVVIATPVDSHKNIAIAALELGKHVYLEKPVGLNVEECELVEKASRSAKGVLQVGFQLRHDPNRAASMKFIQDGGIGKVLYCHGMRHTGDLPHNTPWLFDRKRSGDIIVEQACHILDLFVWAIGAAPLRAMGSGGINLFKDVPPGRSVMDNWSVIWELPNDVRVNFSRIYFDPAGFSGINERVFGSVAAIDLAKAQWGEVAKKGELRTLEVAPTTERAEFFAMEAFVNAARSRSTPLNSIQSANLSTKAAILGRMAIEQKRIVKWSELG